MRWRTQGAPVAFSVLLLQQPRRGGSHTIAVLYCDAWRKQCRAAPIIYWRCRRPPAKLPLQCGSSAFGWFNMFKAGLDCICVPRLATRPHALHVRQRGCRPRRPFPTSDVMQAPLSRNMGPTKCKVAPPAHHPLHQVDAGHHQPPTKACAVAVASKVGRQRQRALHVAGGCNGWQPASV